MNPLGQIYLRTKGVASTVVPSLKSTDPEAVLKQKFLDEWTRHEYPQQEQSLQEMLKRTAENVPYYQKYFAEHTDAQPERLTDWPVLTKQILTEQFEDLKSKDNGGYRTWTHASGGSTGKPVIVTHDEYFSAKASALRLLCADIFFEGPHYNKLILWGMTKEVKSNGSESLADKARTLMGLKTTHVNTFNFTKEKFAQCAEILHKQKPEFIFGYAGSIYELAKYLEEHGIKPKSVKIIGTTAQTLHPFMRECIERVFGCRICDHYGSREVGPLAWENADGLMCFPSFFSKIEVVDEQNNPVSEGEEGRILATTLHNHTMPIIRYDIGDIGVAGPNVTHKGYPCATLKKITGRSSEEFINVEGARINGPFFINLFYYRPWLDQFYVVQRDYDLVEIMYVAKEKGTPVPEQDLAEINGRIKEVMTERCEVKWTLVDEIPTTKAGKRLFIRSEVSPV